MPEPLRLLVVEDDHELAEVLEDELRERGHGVAIASTLAQGRARLDEREFDVVLLDMNLPDGSGIELLRRIADEGLGAEIIVLTGYAEVSTAIEAMKLGAYDYLSKPTRMEELEVVVQKAAEKARLRRDNSSLRTRLQRHEAVQGLLTKDPGMRNLLALVQRAGPADLPVLVIGESGTGKELIARALHQKSPRAAHPFVAINCAAVPENIMESELFGHERGAFTGAVERKLGLLEVAGHGVLLLDEVGDLSAVLQAKLLRVLESREFYRVGGTRLVRLEARLVSATNKDLLEEIRNGRFREDLYYRLNGVTLALPPLRDRKADIPMLARHFLDRLGGGKSLSERAIETLTRYPWPGNVRELDMVIRRAHLLAGDTIEPEHLPHEPPARIPARGPDSDRTLAEIERDHIDAVLKKYDGHRGKAAASLGIDPKTLYNKLRGKPSTSSD